MRYQFFTFIIIFFVVGEILIRFDKKFTVLEESRVIKIKTDIELTEEYHMVKNNHFNPGSLDIKIMVLGDSYIYGGGIDFKNNFSQTLKRLINSQKMTLDKAWVLDVSRPSANNLDHYNTYFEFVDKFSPDLIVLGYNFNDITGNLIKKEQKSKPVQFDERKMSTYENKSTLKKIYELIYQSELLHFLMNKTHNELKANGYLLKGSLSYKIQSTYWNESSGWNKSKKLLSEIIKHSERKGIKLIIYLFPEFNQLENLEIYKRAARSLQNFFESFPSVIFIDGIEKFENLKSTEFRISKYDGHPNEKAHRKIATEVYEEINNLK